MRAGIAGTRPAATLHYIKHAAPMKYIDPTRVSPSNYRELFRRGSVRVVEMRLPAGESDIEHSHPFEMVYFIRGGRARVHVGSDSVDLEIPDGHVMQHEPWTHRVENIGNTEIEAILVEFFDTHPNA